MQFSDMGHRIFLNLTCDIGENKRPRNAALPFLLRIDLWHCHFLKSTCDIAMGIAYQGPLPGSMVGWGPLMGCPDVAC